MLYQGAEAKLYKEGDFVVKDRFSKSYRHPELDMKLRKFRTKREAKVLQKISSLIPSCEYVEHSDSEMKIKMKFIEGPMLKDVFENDVKLYSKLIGENVGILHKNDIIHGDLTTSNMIFNEKLYFIDFGLSAFSDKDEDKAVDLHLLKQALESKHYEVFEGAFELILEEYKKVNPNAVSVLDRLEVVEKRGRHKQQY